MTGRCNVPALIRVHKLFILPSLKVRSGYGIKDFAYTVGTTVKILVDNESQLRIFINDYDLGVAATCLPPVCYAVVDLNGRCEEISIMRNSDTDREQKTDQPIAERQDSQKEKADLEIQEKYPDHGLEQSGKSYRSEVRRRHSREMTKTEQKLSSSDSYNSGIQQISSHAASCSFQTDTDNFNTQIQQLTIDLKSDLQRSLDGATSLVTSSDTYNTEVQILTSQSHSQGNPDDSNIHVQHLVMSNSGVDLPSNVTQNIPRSQSQPFLNKKEMEMKDEKVDEDKEEGDDVSEMSTSVVVENYENEDDDLGVEKTENISGARNGPKNNCKGKRPPITSKLMNLSSQPIRNCHSNVTKRHCDYFTMCLRFKNTLGLPGKMSII